MYRYKERERDRDIDIYIYIYTYIYIYFFFFFFCFLFPYLSVHVYMHIHVCSAVLLRTFRPPCQSAITLQKGLSLLRTLSIRNCVAIPACSRNFLQHTPFHPNPTLTIPCGWKQNKDRVFSISSRLPCNSHFLKYFAGSREKIVEKNDGEALNSRNSMLLVVAMYAHAIQYMRPLRYGEMRGPK